MTAPVELTHCSRCRSNAEFYLDPIEGWVSACCTAGALPVDVEQGDK